MISATVVSCSVYLYNRATPAHTLELPAGLIDKGESAAEAALRELKEETGYVGTVDKVSPPLAMSPGLTDESIHLVTVSVNLDAPENQSPKQMLEDTENIQVIPVQTKDLLKTLDEQSKNGAFVFAALYFLAWAVENAACV